MLSDKQVQALKPTSKDKFLADGGGLYLRVSIHGSKTFLFRSRKGGKARYQTLGEYPHLTLLEARRKAGELQNSTIGDMTLSDAVTKYLSSLDYLHPDQVKNRLERDITPTLGKKRLTAVSTKHLTTALQGIVDRGSPVAANRTLSDVKHVFQFAYEKGWVHSDPSARITRRVVGGKESSRDVVLTDDELKSFMGKLREKKWTPSTRAALALILLTGQRASEVLGIGGEVSGEWWTIPKKRTKSGREQKVYLVPYARKLVPHVVKHTHTTLSRALNRAGYRYTPHDLRRTMRTRMSEFVMPHVAEKCLGHKLEGVLAVYDRYDYLPEKQEAWRLWYAYLRRIMASPMA